MNSYCQLVGHTQANTLLGAKHQGRKLTLGAQRGAGLAEDGPAGLFLHRPPRVGPLMGRVPPHSPMETRVSPFLGTKDLALSGTGLMLFCSGHSR